MNKDELKKELLKLARDAFEKASTLKESERLEVYIFNNEPILSPILEEEDTIVYNESRILCYQIYGYNYLEDEIKTWIDYARVKPQEEKEEIVKPTDMEKSIQELSLELAKKKGVKEEEINSYEIFANLPMTLLGTIEQEILEYWWNAKEEENAKLLATSQIKEALSKI